MRTTCQSGVLRDAGSGTRILRLPRQIQRVFADKSLQRFVSIHLLALAFRARTLGSFSPPTQVLPDSAFAHPRVKLGNKHSNRTSSGWWYRLLSMNAPLPSKEAERLKAFDMHQELLVVENALADNRFSAKPFITGDPMIRFYAGAPLITSDGYALRMLCVIAAVARTLRPEQKAGLQALSGQVVAQPKLRRSMAELVSARDAALEAARRDDGSRYAG
jgi:hypothetical protein